MSEPKRKLKRFVMRGYHKDSGELSVEREVPSSLEQLASPKGRIGLPAAIREAIGLDYRLDWFIYLEEGA